MNLDFRRQAVYKKSMELVCEYEDLHPCPTGFSIANTISKNLWMNIQEFDDSRFLDNAYISKNFPYVLLFTLKDFSKKYIEPANNVTESDIPSLQEARHTLGFIIRCHTALVSSNLNLSSNAFSGLERRMDNIKSKYHEIDEHLARVEEKESTSSKEDDGEILEISTDILGLVVYDTVERGLHSLIECCKRNEIDYNPESLYMQAFAYHFFFISKVFETKYSPTIVKEIMDSAIGCFLSVVKKSSDDRLTVLKGMTEKFAYIDKIIWPKAVNPSENPLRNLAKQFLSDITGTDIDNLYCYGETALAELAVILSTYTIFSQFLIAKYEVVDDPSLKFPIHRHPEESSQHASSKKEPEVTSEHKTLSEDSQTRYLMEDDNGFLVSVPADKVDSWLAAQRKRKTANKADCSPLSETERQEIDRTAQRIYGSQKNKAKMRNE